jgi:hypothetical protein
MLGKNLVFQLQPAVPKRSIGVGVAARDGSLEGGREVEEKGRVAIVHEWIVGVNVSASLLHH